MWASGKRCSGLKNRAIILSTMLLFSTTLYISPISLGDSDIDLYGCYRNYNTDTSKEASVNFDYVDDEIFKMFFIGAKEYDNADYVHLWVYARAWGEPQETSVGHSHEIIIENGDHPHNPPPSEPRYPGGAIAYTFYSFEKFDNPDYQWQRFQLQKSLFKKSSWNRVYIEDVDPVDVGSYHGWDVNNIQIGIDLTFGPADDLDKSYWYSGANPPTPDPKDCTGELMMALEFVDKEKDTQYFPAIGQQWDNAVHNGEMTWIPIDDSNDNAYWYIYLTSTEWTNTHYVRLFVYGYAWTSDPSSETNLKVDVNGHTYNIYPMKDYNTCYPIGAWSWVVIDRAHLKTTSDPWPNYNLFRFYDTTSYTHTNLGIALFPNKDEDHSCWKYNAGSGDVGHCDWELDQGELGVYLVLYGDALADIWDRTIYTMELSNSRTQQIEPYDPALDYIWDGSTVLGNKLENEKSWDHDSLVQQDYRNGNIMQGKIYSELYDNQGDYCDIIVLSGHGEESTGWWILPQYSLPDDHSYDDVAFFKTLPEDYSEAEYYEFGYSNFAGADYGEDGFSFNTDWLFFFSCDILGNGNDQFYSDSAWRTLLFHGMHGVFGYFNDFVPRDEKYDDFISDFYDYLTNGGLQPANKIITAFKTCSEGTHLVQFEPPNSYYNGWAYFIHDNCVDDYIWDQGSVGNDPDMWQYEKFEHKNDISYDYRKQW